MNISSAKEFRASYYQTNKEKLVQYQKEYYKNNFQKIKNYQANYWLYKHPKNSSKKLKPKVDKDKKKDNKIINNSFIKNDKIVVSFTFH
jgi:hypothetical protein